MAAAVNHRPGPSYNPNHVIVEAPLPPPIVVDEKMFLPLRVDKWTIAEAASFVKRTGRGKEWTEYAALCVKEEIDGSTLTGLEAEDLVHFGFKKKHADTLKKKLKKLIVIYETSKASSSAVQSNAASTASSRRGSFFPSPSSRRGSVFPSIFGSRRPTVLAASQGSISRLDSPMSKSVGGSPVASFRRAHRKQSIFASVLRYQAETKPTPNPNPLGGNSAATKDSPVVLHRQGVLELKNGLKLEIGNRVDYKDKHGKWHESSQAGDALGYNYEHPRSKKRDLLVANIILARIRDEVYIRFLDKKAKVKRAAKWVKTSDTSKFAAHHTHTVRHTPSATTSLHNQHSYDSSTQPLPPLSPPPKGPAPSLPPFPPKQSRISRPSSGNTGPESPVPKLSVQGSSRELFEAKQKTQVEEDTLVTRPQIPKLVIRKDASETATEKKEEHGVEELQPETKKIEDDGDESDVAD